MEQSNILPYNDISLGMYEKEMIKNSFNANYGHKKTVLERALNV